MLWLFIGLVVLGNEERPAAAQPVGDRPAMLVVESAPGGGLAALVPARPFAKGDAGFEQCNFPLQWVDCRRIVRGV